ncbi:MAG: hypothetical protein Q9174_007532, partial [Haloplaca sp. 1 TL-2023]
AAEQQPQDFEAKYRNSGKYAANTPQALKDPLPKQILARGIQELPRLDLQSDSKDDFSDDSDEAEQDEDGMYSLDHGACSNSPYLDLAEGSMDDTSISDFEAVKLVDDSVSAIQDSKKRKREESVENGSLTVSLQSLETPRRFEGQPDNSFNTCQPVKKSGSTARDLLKSLRPGLSKTSNRFIGNDQDFIQIAQSVADQKIFGISFEDDTSALVASGSILDALDGRGFSMTALDDALLKVLPSASRLDLKALLGLDLQHSVALSKMSPPYISVRRGKDSMEISPPALYFWEELGLAPSQQDKDVTAFM